MPDGHRTSSIPRPRAATRAGARPDSTRDHTLFGEFTRPIPRDKQVVRGRGKRTLVVAGACLLAAALVAALFVLPVQAWLRQRDDIARAQRELAVLDEANARLEREVRRLQTPDGVKEAAREEIGFGEPGEVRLTVMPTPGAPLALPAGWPYDAVTGIVAVRTAEAAAATEPPVTTP